MHINTQHYVEHSSVRRHMTRVPTEDVLDGMRDLSSGGYKLLMYYYARRNGWKFVDEEIADTIGVTERRLKDLRKELIDKGYLYIISAPEAEIYHVGREAVLRRKVLGKG